MTRRVLTALLTLAAALPLGAQVTLRADAALGSASPTPTPAPRRLWSVGGAAEWLRPAFRLLAEGEYREFGPGRHGSFGRLAGSWYRPVAGPVTVELTGEGSGLTHPGQQAAGLLLGGARFHVHGAAHGLWLGSQAGRDAVGSVVRWEGAAWQRFGALTVQLQASQTASRALVRTTPTDTLSLSADSTREAQRVRTDVGAWLGWHGGPLELGGALGHRFGITEPAGGLGSGPGDELAQRRARVRGVTWWMVEGRWWLSGTIGLVGAAGYQPPDGSLRTPGGRFGKFGLTATLPRGRRPGSPAVFPRSGRERVGGLVATRVSRDSVEFRLPLPHAARVELMADFTHWTPVLLEAEPGGLWVLRAALPPGRYSVNVRVDGGPWRPPQGVPVVADDFGGSSGLVVVQ